MRKISILIICCAVIFTWACVHEPDLTSVPTPTNPPTTSTGIPCDPDTVYFQTTILPLLASSCAIPGCHDNITMEDGINFTSYENVMASDVIDVSDPWDSDIMEVITENDLSDRMPPPPNNALSQEQINLIYTWISQGALNNTCQAACDTNVFTFSGAVQPIIQARCQGCHSGGAPQGGISLTNHSQIQAVAVTGQLYGAVSHTGSYTPMPYNGSKIPECEIAQIRKWIEDGTPNN